MIRSAASRQATRCPGSDPRSGSPPGTVTTPASSRTTGCAGRRSAGLRPSPTAATSPARGSTAGTSAGARPATRPSSPRPPAGSCAPIPSNPIAVSRSCTPSARIFPPLRSTSSSTLPANSSPPRPPRGHGRVGPASRCATYRSTVLRIGAGQLRRRVRAAGQVKRLQNLHDLPARLGHGPSGPDECEADTSNPSTPGGSTRIRTRRSPGDLMTVHREF